MRPYSAQAPPAYTHKSSRTTSMYYNLKTKNNTINALTQQSRHGNLHSLLPFKKGGSLSKDPTSPFRLIFVKCFFWGWFCFSENCPQRAVGSSGSPFGWCRFSSSLLLGGVRLAFSFFGWCCFFLSFWLVLLCFLHLGGAVVPHSCCECAVLSRSLLWVVLFFLLSMVGKCCFLLLGSGAFLPSSFRWLHVLISQNKVSLLLLGLSFVLFFMSLVAVFLPPCGFQQSNFHNNKGSKLKQVVGLCVPPFSLSKYLFYISLLNFPRILLFFS